MAKVEGMEEVKTNDKEKDRGSKGVSRTLSNM